MADEKATCGLCGEPMPPGEEVFTYHGFSGPCPQGARMSEATIQPGEHITQFFAYAHLPPHLAAVSKPFADLADVVMGLPRNPERTVALRKLLEAKDAAVRAKLAK